MKNKEKYYKALVENNGALNEIDLGEKMGLDSETVSRIISQLMSEYKIEYVQNNASNYRKRRASHRGKNR